MVYLRELFPDWDVDVEYDRDGYQRKHIRVPYHPRFNPQNNPIYFPLPDIIIHHRGPNDNLVVIEMKKSANKDMDEFERDIFKLRCYKKRPLYYKIALFIIINTDNSLGAPYTIEEID
jgi:hypothetical protein